VAEANSTQCPEANRLPWWASPQPTAAAAAVITTATIAVDAGSWLPKAANNASQVPVVMPHQYPPPLLRWMPPGKPCWWCGPHTGG